MNFQNDFSRTIVAPTTALGTGSISVIRISGKDAIVIVNNIFKGKDLTKVKANTIHFGHIMDGTYKIDQVLVSVFKSPHSYTGEDCLEISCHANPYIINDIIESLISCGADHAKPGEFTLRAFLNGRIDLSQAEAVAQIIQAKSKAGVKNALNQLDGSLLENINLCKKGIIDIISRLEIDLDFSEEAITIVSKIEINNKIIAIESKLKALIDSFNSARILSNGITMTIIGQPNVGKSTLLNTLLGENRAITSHIPGTTRDTIHENLLIKDILFKIIDTAGLRKTAGRIEIEGIRRAKSKIEISDIILLVIDTSEKMSKSSFELLSDVVQTYSEKIIIVANKIDKGKNQKTLQRIKSFKMPLVSISAKLPKNIHLLKEKIVKKTTLDYDTLAENIVINDLRQKNALIKAVRYLKSAARVNKKKLGNEFTTIELREALNALGEITGETVTEDILNNIFSNFCIGK